MANGKWSDVFDWPIIGVHAILTPDGKVLTFGTDQNGIQGGLHVFDVWDPVTNTHHTLEHKVHTDLFCSAGIISPDSGEIIITGGDTRPFAAPNNGVADVNVFDPSTMTLSPSASGDMTYGRWYPTLLTLANGKTLVLGGRDGAGNAVVTPELYTPDVGWKTLNKAATAQVTGDWFYPRGWLASDGRVIILGEANNGKNGMAIAMDPSGEGHILGTYATPFKESENSPSIMFQQDKVLTLADNGTVWISNFSGAGAPTFTRTADAGTRIWSNMTLLADGTVMLSGGSVVANALQGVKNTVAIWHPNTGTWTYDTDAAVARLYHSTTLLLPDATVLSLGGGAPGPLNNLNGEIYKPAYLFNDDGTLATRPVILDAPTDVEQREDITITVDNPGSISRLTLIKYGAVTHSFNMEARKLDLGFTVGGDGKLHVNLPDNANVLVPGDWMLFAFNQKGTPSVAARIHVESGGELYSESAGAFVTMNGSTTYNKQNEVFTLTPDANWMAGSVFTNKVVDLSHDFSINFDVNLGWRDGGADGVSFVMHNDPNGGDAIGVGGAVQGAYGISNGLAIEFDTWNNGWKYGDIIQDHTAITDTDATLNKSKVTEAVALGNIEDGKWHSVKVVWDADTKTLSYMFDGKAVGTLSKDLAEAYFGGSNLVHFGFTGSTGGAKNLQQVRINSVDAQFADPSHGHAMPDEHVDCACAFAIEHLADFVTLSGSARYNATTNVATLTPEAPWKIGALMSDDRIDLDQNFIIQFDIFAGKADAGADGLAFVLHNDPVGSRAVGAGGGALGAGGIRNGLAIEFDTWNNGANVGDIAADHTRFFDTDAAANNNQITKAVGLGNIEDGFWHAVQVSWNAASQTLTYSFDGVTVGTLTRDLSAAFFGGSQFAHFGFTAATGGATSLQQVRVVGVDATFEDGAHDHHDEQAPAMDLSGSGIYNRAGGAVTLTPNAQWKTGGVMSEERIDISHDFTIALDIFLGGKDAGADGLAFVLHNDWRGADALGTGGDGLGAYGIKKGLGIEFDTWNNGAAVFDIAGDHTRFIDTDAATSKGALSPAVNLGNIENGQWHAVKVNWDAETHTLSYTFDGKYMGALTKDLQSTYFGDSQFVHFGATAATGGATNLQQVRFVSVDATFEHADDNHHMSDITMNDTM